MPIAKIQLPDGRIAKFEVPEGTTPEQVTQFAAQQFQQQKTAPQEQSVPTAADVPVMENLAAGAGKAISDAGTGIKQALMQYGNKMPLSAMLSPQQQMTLGYGGHDLNKKLIPDEVVQAQQQEIDETRKRDAPLMETGAGKAGNIAGNIGMTLPALAIPGANTYAGSALAGGMMGLVQPTAEGESRGLNTALGAVGGAAGKYGSDKLAKALGAIPKAASKKIAKIEAEVSERAAKQAAAETASARSAAGNAAQDTYKQLEHLRELNAKGLLSAEGKKAAKALEKELAQKAAEKLLPSAARKETTSIAYKEAIETEGGRAAQIAADKLSNSEIKSQIGARLKRYGPAAVGGMIGNMLFPGLGGMIGGAATGLTLRPTIRSMANLLKNPALQRKALTPVAKAKLIEELMRKKVTQQALTGAGAVGALEAN